jgi:glyoxylase-like metal-dependent hydrolase (beta-lactamase superfamily II)
MLNVKPDRFLTEGDTVTVGAMTWRVLHTPGHTPGHISFDEADRLAITGTCCSAAASDGRIFRTGIMPR